MKTQYDLLKNGNSVFGSCLSGLNFVDLRLTCELGNNDLVPLLANSILLSQLVKKEIFLTAIIVSFISSSRGRGEWV